MRCRVCERPLFVGEGEDCMRCVRDATRRFHWLMALGERGTAFPRTVRIVGPITIPARRTA